MMKRLLIIASVSFCLAIVTLNAQTTISGVITDAELGDPLIGANVIIKGTTVGASTDFDGNFSLTSENPLPWTLEVSYTGYAEQVIQVTSSQSNMSISLQPSAILGQEVIVSASRRREKVQEAPASVSVLSAKKLLGSPQTDATRNLINVPGVHIQQQSAARINIEMRAGSGVFGTSVFPIKDYRSLIGPGIGTFQSDNVGLSTIDLARIEVVRGAGSALYGPGVTSGVVHFITKSAIDVPGTTVQVYGGEGNTFGGAVRHAGGNSAKTFGYKINFQHNRGDEFTLDGSEGTTDASGVFTRQFDKFQDKIIQPVVTNGIVDLTQPGKVLLELERRADGNVMQDDYFSTSGDITFEFRPQDDLSVVVAGGYNQASAVFYNDLGEGVFQGKEFWGQARVQKGGLFAQAFYVTNDGGTEDNPTYLYQSGNRSPIGRSQVEAQVQYNFDVPALLNANITVGSDYRKAISRTEHLVYGREENDDDFSIIGAYVQGKFALASKLDLVLAGRYDQFNFLDDAAFSPRAVIVYKASPKHTFRVSYNHASFSPTAIQWNIDFPVNAPIPGVFDFWLAGQKEIQDFGSNPNIEFVNQNVVAAGIAAATGLPIDFLTQLAGLLPDELPAAGLGSAGLPNELINQVASGALLAQLEANGLGAVIPLIMPILATAPTGSNGVFVGVNPFEAPGSPGFLNNNLTNTITGKLGSSKTYEIGYKGLIGEKFGVSWDIYRITESGGSDFTAIAPLISLQGANTDAYTAIAGQIAAALIGAGVPQDAAAALAGVYGGAAQLIPNYYGTGTVETNRVPQGDGILHVAAGYRIFDAPYTRYGSDLGVQYYLSNDLSFFGNYSWLNNNQFERRQDENSPPFTTFISSPKDKFRLGFNYQPEAGFRANLSYQHDESFFGSVGQFSGTVPAKNLIDAGVGYVFGNGLAIDLTATNLFDNKYRTYVNMPLIGRRALVRLTYDFGGDKEE